MQSNILPLFKSHYSVGRSVLTLDDDENRGIFPLLKEANLNELWITENSFSSFRVLNRECQNRGINLRFGCILPTVHDLSDRSHQVVYFALNSQGVKDLKKIHNICHLGEGEMAGKLVFPEIEDYLSNILVAIPFYDSFIFNNIFKFGLSHLPNLNKHKYIFFEESNSHPFDSLISDALHLYEQDPSKIIAAKSIYYKNREDCAAHQFLRAASNRAGGKKVSVNNPGLEGYCSKEFCWESWKEVVGIK